MAEEDQASNLAQLTDYAQKLAQEQLTTRTKENSKLLHGLYPANHELIARLKETSPDEEKFSKLNNALVDSVARTWANQQNAQLPESDVIDTLGLMVEMAIGDRHIEPTDIPNKELLIATTTEFFATDAAKEIMPKNLGISYKARFEAILRDLGPSSTPPSSAND